jgi:hypothetical protein
MNLYFDLIILKKILNHMLFQARPLLIEALEKEDFEILADPRLGKNYNRNEMFRMIEAAAACVRHSSVKRPRMNQVILEHGIGICTF